MSIFCSSARAAKVCEIVGFESRDGYYFPITQCTGYDSYVSKTKFWNGPSGGGFGFGGNYLGSQGSTSSGNYTSTIPRSTQQPSSFGGYKSPLSSSALTTKYPTESVKPSNVEAENAAKEYSRKMEAHNESLRRVRVESEARLAKSLAESQARMNQNMTAALIMMGWAKAIHLGIESQIEMETKSAEKSKVENASAREGILKSIVEQDSEIKSIQDPSFSDRNLLTKEEKVFRKIITDNSQGRAGDVDSYLELIDVAISVTSSENAPTESKQLAAGAVAMTIAASEAKANGDLEAANRFKELAKVSVDIALGFVPVVSSINDLSQVVFGIATGRDYTGKEMRSADYAFRGVGIVLGFFPVVRLGQFAINNSFMRGVELIKSYPALTQRFEVISKLGERFSVFVKFIGAAIPKEVFSVDFLKKNYLLFPRIADHAIDLSTRLSLKESDTLLAFLKQTRLNITDHWQLIHSFQVGSIELITLNKGDKLYRWSSNYQAGRYFSSVLIETPEAARALLALPTQNSMLKLAEFEVSTSTQALKGVIGANFGHPGGGVQLILDPSKVTLKKILR